MAEIIFYFFTFIGIIVFMAYYTYRLVDDMRRRKALNDFLEGKNRRKENDYDNFSCCSCCGYCFVCDC